MSQPTLPQLRPRKRTCKAPLYFSVCPQSTPPTAKQLFVQFLEDFLEIDFVGFQSRFGHGCDLILFRAPNTGSTLAVDCDILLETRAKALEIVRSKLLINEIQFLETR